MNEKSLHERIIECAYEMFVQRGVKSVTMDEISSELSISKRTLYEEFSSKIELVEEIIAEMDKFYRKRNDEIAVMDIGAIEKIFMQASINTERNNKETIFFGDIIRNFPALINKLIIKGNESNVKRILANIEQGCEEGMFYSDINVDIPINLLFELKFSNDFRMIRKMDLRDVHIFSVVFFLRSIATPKGIEKINDLCRINNINIFK